MTAADAAAEMTTTAHHNHHHHHHHHNHHHHFNHINQPASPNILNETTNNSKSADSASSSPSKLKTSLLLASNALNNKLKTGADTIEPSAILKTQTKSLAEPSKQPEHAQNQPSDTNAKQEDTVKMDTTPSPAPTPASNIAQQNEKQVESNSVKVDKHAQFKLDKEKEEFNQRLIEFHKHKNVNTPMISWPTFNGQPIDLHKLYSKVVSLGGWEKVCEKEKWNEVVQHLNAKLFGSCANGEHALKLIYMRYLSLYEKVHLSLATTPVSTTYSSSTSSLSVLLDNLPSGSLVNPLPPSTNSFGSMSTLGAYKSSLASTKDDDNDAESLLIGKKRFTYLTDSVPMNYNHSQHVQGASTVSSGGVSIAPGLIQTGLGWPQTSVLPSAQFGFNPYEKLENALKSGLANEVDFAFNTILLLSSDEQHAFKIYSSSNLIALMLAHVGFFGTNDTHNFRHLYDTVWHPADDGDDKTEPAQNFLEQTIEEHIHDRMTNKLKLKPRRNFVKFWHSAVKLPEESIECDDFDYKSLISELMPKLYNSYLASLPGAEMLNLKETKEESCVEFRRIEQVMVTLNNLSFEENNAEFMVNKCSSLLEFLIMCLYCTNGVNGVEIRKHALDILANLSRKIKLRNLSDKHRCLFLMSIIHLIIGQQEQQQETNESTFIVTISNEDRLEIIRGLEILTKLCSHEINLNDDDLNNEKLIAKYLLDKKKNYFYLERILLRLEQLLAIQDMLILMHCLECLYSMSLYNETICNFIANYKSSETAQPKLVATLVNLLTIDMTHFGLQNAAAKVYKVMPSNAALAVSSQALTQAQAASPVQLQQNKSQSLLQQTLNNQHNTGMAVAAASKSSTAPQVNKNDQQAKNILCNWLVTCFHQDSTSELSKTQLYPYYQQIAKMNNWSVLTIPVFFEILNATFPNLKYDEQTSKIIGLKLVLNVKQQIQLKHQIFNQGQMCKNVPLSVSTMSSNPMPTPPLTNSNELSISSSANIPLSPPPSVCINITAPSIPLLTPPTPPVTHENVKQTWSEQKPEASESDKNPLTKVKVNGIDGPKLNGVVEEKDKVIESIEDRIESAKKEAHAQMNGNCSADELKKLNNHSDQNGHLSAADEQTNKNELNPASIDENSSSSSMSTTSSSTSTTQSSTESKHTESSESVELNKRKIDDANKTNENESDKSQADASPTPNTQTKRMKLDETSDSAQNSSSPMQQTETAQAYPTTSTPPQAQTSAIVNALNSNAAQVQYPVQQPTPPIQQANQSFYANNEQNVGDYMCEWNNCKRMFPTAKAVYNHVCKYHLLNSSIDNNGMLCMWSYCDQIKRQKWSLVNHLQERHCNENALKTAIACRQRGLIPATNNSSLSNSVLNYAKDAAFVAIQRHQRVKKEDFLSCEEGPITKSLRLLSALILRNLARNSDTGKISIKPYESVLTNVAFDLLESSNAVANCLWHLSH